MRRTPAFPLAAIVTLAIGIGATTAIFSTVNAALLKSLPYPNSTDLYSVRTTLTDGRVTTGLLSPVELQRLNGPNLSIARVAGLTPNDVTLLRNDGTPLKTVAYGVSEGFFDVFGLPLTMGGFSKAPPSPNTPPQVMISYRIWKDLYGGASDVVGKPIRFAEIQTTIAGVAPKDFDTPAGANFWFQIPLDPKGVAHNFEGYMRIKPGANIGRVKSEMEGVMASVAHDFPESAKARIYVTRPLVESIVGELGPILIVVLSATGLLLLLACVNVTNLLLARGATRSREIAVRVAIGAGRARIVRQLLTESMVLATSGAVVGIFAAYAFVRVLLRMGASKLPRLDTLSFDSSVLMFTLVALFVSGILVGFAPALRLAATNVNTLMNEGARSSTGGRGTARWLSALTVAEIALAVALVGGAGWLVRSFNNLSATDPGFTPEGRLTFAISLQGPNFKDQAAVYNGYTQLIERLKGISTVKSAATFLDFPLRNGQENSLFMRLQGDPVDASHMYNTRQRIVSPGFFSTMGIKLIAGRDFDDHDRQGTTPVAIVNRTFENRYLTERDPLTVRFSAGYPEVDLKNALTIVGVVEDVRQRSLSVAPEPAYYTSTGQGMPRREFIVVHSSSVDSTALQSSIRDEVRKLDPQIPVDFERVSDVVSATLNRQQLGMTLMLVFAAAAIALAAVGIYGVISYSATQRRKEVAIRLALGASEADVFRLVLKQGASLAAAGAAIGLLVAYQAGRVVASSLYEVKASDPMILGVATAIVVGITILATLIPAYRVARLDPGHVLRPE
jgi:putative ABC transport system permease protein